MTVSTYPSEKVCFRCGATKPLTDFYRHSGMADGRLNKCKECTKTDVSVNYAGKRQQYAEYERKRYQESDRHANALERHKAHNERNPDKYRARYAVNNALRDGRLVRGPCEKQPCDRKVEAHHDDYTQPLAVHWMCRKHHLEEHGKIAYS
jgi:hypothetical protein